jgi:hypothetical protein
MSNFNYASITETNTEASAASSTATLSGIKGKQLQIVGFDGSSADQPYQVQLLFGSTVILTMQGPADASVGRDFGDIGPIAADGEDVSCVCTPAASGQCNANIIARIVM